MLAERAVLSSPTGVHCPLVGLMLMMPIVPRGREVRPVHAKDS